MQSTFPPAELNDKSQFEKRARRVLLLDREAVARLSISCISARCGRTSLRHVVEGGRARELSIFMRRVTSMPAQSMAGSAFGTAPTTWVERHNIAEDSECNWKAEAVDQRDRTSVVRDFRASGCSGQERSYGQAIPLPVFLQLIGA